MMPAQSAVQSMRERLPHTALAALRGTLVRPDDAKIPRLLAIVDRVQKRGPIDDMIAPFRPRMAQLRPPRPLRFIRLLFMPLDPVIMASQAWRPKMPAIPRNALPPLATAVRASLGPEAARIDRALAGRTTRDRSVVSETGPPLWSAAATALMRCAVPDDWQEHVGLPPGLFQPLAASAGIALGQVMALQQWRAEAELGKAVRVSAAQQMLQTVYRAQPEALSLVIALVLARLPQTARGLRAAIAEIGGQVAVTMRKSMETAATGLFERLEAANAVESLVLGTPLRETGAEVRRILGLLASIDLDDAKASLRGRVMALRSRLNESCRLRFSMGLDVDVLQPLERTESSLDNEQIERLEDAARGLSELAAAAASVGSAGVYEDLLRQTTEVVKEADVACLTLADRARLIEILAGPDAAWALLEAC